MFAPLQSPYCCVQRFQLGEPPEVLISSGPHPALQNLFQVMPLIWTHGQILVVKQALSFRKDLPWSGIPAGHRMRGGSGAGLASSFPTAGLGRGSCCPGWPGSQYPYSPALPGGIELFLTSTAKALFFHDSLCLEPICFPVRINVPALAIKNNRKPRRDQMETEMTPSRGINENKEKQQGMHCTWITSWATQTPAPSFFQLQV